MAVETNKPDIVAEAQEHLEQGYTYEEAEEPEKALRQCELAIRLAPNLAEAYNLQGIVLEQLGHGEQAIAAYSEAIRLDPDFEESQQNLLEAQNELEELERNLHRKQALKTARWGALSYGISFAVIGAITAVSKTHAHGFMTLAFETLLYTLAGGFGAAILRIGGGSRNDVFPFAIVGALGCGLSYLVTAILYRVLSSFLLLRATSLDVAFTVALTVRFAVVGACTGALLGIVQRDWKQVGWLTSAGATGFALYGLSSPLLFALALSISGFIPGSIGDVKHDSVVFAIAYAVQGTIVGSISGALLGLATGQRKLDSS